MLRKVLVEISSIVSKSPAACGTRVSQRAKHLRVLTVDSRA